MNQKEQALYYPIQIPYLLDRSFSEVVEYREFPAGACDGFVICFWEMVPRGCAGEVVDNVIVADGCIDLVADMGEGTIGFSGSSQTDFHFPVDSGGTYVGARMAPGAFHQITSLAAPDAMDSFVPLSQVFDDFDDEAFFALPAPAARVRLESYLREKTQSLSPDRYTRLFDELSACLPTAVGDVCDLLGLGTRQCQRVFAQRYGISPKAALCIIRFQACLAALLATDRTASAAAHDAGYYDQPHFIKDFKRYLGITPFELVRLYRFG